MTRRLLSLFIGYHVVVMIVSSLPSDGPAAGLQRLLTRVTLMRLYAEATANSQNWRFFSPEPPRENVFMRVLVQDAGGTVTDVQHDSHGRQRFPYLWYDHLRKVNRRLATESAYERGYAAWVCRTWERTHGGHAADSVRFVRLTTRVPPPAEAFATGGFDPAALPLRATDAGRYACAELPQGQLPPDLRRRFGLAAAGDTPFKPAELHTWWTERGARRSILGDAPRRDDAPLE